MARRRLGLVLGLLLAGCGKGGDHAPAARSAVDGVLASWQQAGLEPASFDPVEGKPLGEGTCRAGTVKGIAATVCEYSDAAAAKRAETAGFAQVQASTGLALAEGRLLLVLADRESKDPSGKSMNQIAKTFRNR